MSSGGKEIHPYYRERLQSIIEEMISNMELSRSEFARLVPQAPFELLVERSCEEIRDVLRHVPYAGGDEGRMTPFFRLGAGTIAVGRALRHLDASSETISAMMRRIFLARIEALPKAERHELGRQWLSKANQDYLRQQAGVSQSRENPGDFVYTFVEKDADDDAEPFEFGIDYSECGFCKICREGGDEDLLPHICAMDKESYGIRGIVLQRTTTLASGAGRCNFRFGPIPEDGEDE